MTLRAAGFADFAFIRDLVRSPDCAPYLTDEDESGLAAYLADSSARLQIWDIAGQPAGFALWCDVGAPGGVIELRRLALSQTGQGAGLGFVQALTDYGFTDLNASRIWLDAIGENIRAQKTYVRAGYVVEGCLRAHDFRPALGRVSDMVLFGMLRDEWLQRRTPAAQAHLAAPPGAN